MVYDAPQGLEEVMENTSLVMPIGLAAIVLGGLIFQAVMAALPVVSVFH